MILTLHSNVQEKADIKRRPTEGQTPVSNAPVVPFDMDLYHWDNSEGKPPPIKKVW